MRIGILSDIHGNLEALEASLNFLKNKADFIVSMGDVVGYGPDPENCAEIISEQALVMTMGNHEESLIRKDFSGLRETARISLEWTAKNLSPACMEKLNGWPVKAEKEGATFVHASLSKPLHRYLTRNKEAEEEFPLLEGELCFIGHTHMPGGFMQDVSTGKIETIFPDFGGGMKLAMDDGHRYIVNVGSVGQPRDGFPFACAAIYDKDKKLVTIHRLEYPLEKTRCKIIEKGLPSVLAKRIMQGI